MGTGLVFGIIVIASVSMGPWSNALLWISVSSLAVREHSLGVFRICSAMDEHGYRYSMAKFWSVRTFGPFEPHSDDLDQ